VAVRQDRQADDWATEAVIDAVVVGIHPLGKLSLRLALNLDVEQQPALGATMVMDADQDVGKALA
jgi:hypothetical protein